MTRVNVRGETPTEPASVIPRTVSLGGGLVVPYPEPADSAATRAAKGNRRTDTKPEVRLRSALHRRGLRFRKDLLLRCGGLRVRPDIVFPRRRLCVFVDGCFWHGCPLHQKVPHRNREYWAPKLRRNVERDRQVEAALTSEGWGFVRVWEHEPIDEAADRVASEWAASNANRVSRATSPKRQ